MGREKIYVEEDIPSPLHQLWSSFKQSNVAMVGFWCYLFLVFLAIFAPFFIGERSIESDLNQILIPPAWQNDGNVSYLLGTDDLGRDIFYRILQGTSLTFGLSIIVVLISSAIGVLIGAFAALSKGVRASVLNHFLDVILSIPSLLLAIIIVAIIGPSLQNTLWAIVIVLIPQFIRITRNAVKEEFRKDYVMASKLDGASNMRILSYSVFPNIIERIINQATLAQSVAILDIAALGFLGLGAQIPLPEWGAMLSNGLNLFYIAPWTVYLPGFAIFFAVLATNLVGEGLRHALKVRKEG